MSIQRIAALLLLFSMQEKDVEMVLQRALEKTPGAKEMSTIIQDQWYLYVVDLFLVPPKETIGNSLPLFNTVRDLVPNRWMVPTTNAIAC